MLGGGEASEEGVTDLYVSTRAIVDATSHAEERPSGYSPAYSPSQYVIPTVCLFGPGLTLAVSQLQKSWRLLM